MEGVKKPEKKMRERPPIQNARHPCKSLSVTEIGKDGWRDGVKVASKGGWASAVSGSTAFHSAGRQAACATESCAAGVRDRNREKGYEMTGFIRCLS
jgi:hypothetical protein